MHAWKISVDIHKSDEAHYIHVPLLLYAVVTDSLQPPCKANAYMYSVMQVIKAIRTEKQFEFDWDFEVWLEKSN